MIIGAATSRLKPGQTLLLLGLSEDNLTRLRNQEPLVLTRESHGSAIPEHLTIMIIAGTTEESLRDSLQQQGLIGLTTVSRDHR